MAQFEEASPICRGKNLSWETILLFFNNMPKAPMPKADFNSYVESRIDSWIRTHSQLARQLAFYYEEDGVCYPRFTKETSYTELFRYMQNWAAKYFIPNPYAPSLKGHTPTSIYAAVKQAILNGESGYDDILDSILGVPLSSHDKINVYLSNFTDLIINSNKEISVNSGTTHINAELHPDPIYATDYKKYFDYFSICQDESLYKKEDLIIQEKASQIIYYGAPGTGKSFEINRITKNKEVIRTTFHPDSDYSTFVGAYKPTSIEVPVRDVTGKVIVENGKQVTENRIVYEFVEQAFLQAYTKAWCAYADKEDGEKAEEQYLVIEEINRGNCAQIFGDLFQLLDRNGYGFSDYPITADKDMKKQLSKAFDKKTIADAEWINSIYGKDIVSQVLSGDILLLPDNLYIWATMNTSDQSLFPIDSAFKRRWDWKYMPICEGKENGVSLGWKIKVNGKLYNWWQFVEKINAEINEQTKSEDKKLGYFFCKAQNGIVSAETFVSKVIFYLWNDVFKDQAFASDIFRDGEEELTFNKFYDVNANGKAVVKEDKVELFLQNLGVGFAEETIVDDEAEEAENPEGGSSKHKSLRSVTFPDGTVYSVENLTHFDVYVESLKKMGLDQVYPLIADMKYRRKGCPMMSTEELPGILNSDFTYQKEGNYYIVKGAIDDTLINILSELKNKLNLDVQVNYE